MIHFFPTFGREAKNSPFALELISLAVPHRLFPGEVILRYRSRIWLLLMGWPKMAWFGLKSAVRSLVLSNPYPDVVVVGSHIEAIIFGFIRALYLRKKPTIVLLGFILTKRNSSLVNRCREFYFSFIFSIVDQAICHSKLEVERYSQLFRNSLAKFVYIPYGLHISGSRCQKQPSESALENRPYILAAGRSGRDYATLFQAVEQLAVDLHVVCDSENALNGLNIPTNVSVLRNCYDDDYVNELRNSAFVAIPLGVNDISAGQMVLIQAMAFGKPTIVTRTPTVEEYVSDGEQSLLVTQGSVSEFREAINKLLSDKDLAKYLATNAIDIYEKKYCMRAYVQNLVASVTLSSSNVLNT